MSKPQTIAPKIREKQLSPLVEFKLTWVFNFSLWFSQALAALALMQAKLSYLFLQALPEVPGLSLAFESLARGLINGSEGIRIGAITELIRAKYEEIPREARQIPTETVTSHDSD